MLGNIISTSNKESKEDLGFERTGCNMNHNVYVWWSPIPPPTHLVNTLYMHGCCAIRTNITYSMYVFYTIERERERDLRVQIMIAWGLLRVIRVIIWVNMTWVIRAIPESHWLTSRPTPTHMQTHNTRPKRGYRRHNDYRTYQGY